MQADLLEPTLRGQVKQPTLLLMHILAGRSILTVKSNKTGERYTFRFSRPDLDDHNAWVMGNYQERKSKGRPIWVAVYGGPAGDFTNEGNERRNWSLLGTIWPAPLDQGPEFTYRHSRKSKIGEETFDVRAVKWIAKHLAHQVDVLLEKADWWHEGVCGRCGRRLTVPESIDTGFGPECKKIVGL